MCERNCNCVICEMESMEKAGHVNWDDEIHTKKLEYQLKAMDLFDEFVHKVCVECHISDKIQSPALILCEILD